MAGVSQGPTPWWQLPEYAGKAANLEASAPPGYTYDKVKMDYVPIVGSATDMLSQRAKLESALGLDGTSGSFGVGGGATGSASSSFPTVPYGGGGASGAPPTVQWPGVGTGTGTGTGALPTAHIEIPDDTAAQLAIWNRAKDQVGKETSSSLTALRSALASRGLLGGGIEGKSTARLLTAGAGQLADTTRTQAVNESSRRDDFAKLGYQGAIEQRGQDITTSEGAANRALDAAKAAYSGGITQRGQDIGSSDTRFTGGITMRGQDITNSNAAADRAVGVRGQNLGALSTLLTKLY